VNTVPARLALTDYGLFELLIWHTVAIHARLLADCGELCAMLKMLGRVILTTEH